MLGVHVAADFGDIYHKIEWSPRTSTTMVIFQQILGPFTTKLNGSLKQVLQWSYFSRFWGHLLQN